MGFFSNVTRVIGDVFEEAGAAVGDVVVDTVDILDPILGPRGQRGRTLGESIGGPCGASARPQPPASPGAHGPGP